MIKRSHHRALSVVGIAGLCAATLAVTAVGTADAAGPAPYLNSVTGTSSTYTAVPGSLTWDEAFAAAATTTAPSGCTNHLAVITSAGEQLYIDNTLGEQDSLFIGAQRAEDHGAFEWVTGEPFVYQNWGSGEPNDTDPGEPYAQFRSGNSWNDIYADTVSGYILETECTAVGPRVTAVSPSSGPATGGNTITITGSGFTGAPVVLVGGKRASEVSVVSDSEVTAVVPEFTKRVPATGKVVDVQVKVKKVKSAKTAADRYVYTQSNNT